MVMLFTLPTAGAYMLVAKGVASRGFGSLSLIGAPLARSPVLRRHLMAYQEDERTKDVAEVVEFMAPQTP
jgi:hypothetical protein